LDKPLVELEKLIFEYAESSSISIKAAGGANRRDTVSLLNNPKGHQENFV
jgi:hypothetical protein